MTERFTKVPAFKVRPILTCHRNVHPRYLYLSEERLWFTAMDQAWITLHTLKCYQQGLNCHTRRYAYSHFTHDCRLKIIALVLRAVTFFFKISQPHAEEKMQYVYVWWVDVVCPSGYFLLWSLKWNASLSQFNPMITCASCREND